MLVLYFAWAFLEANLFSSPRKVRPHDHHQTVHRFQSHQQVIDLKDQQKLQYTPNKVSIFVSSSNDRATV